MRGQRRSRQITSVCRVWGYGWKYKDNLYESLGQGRGLEHEWKCTFNETGHL